MKYFFTLFAIGFMVFFMVFGCSTEPGRNVTTGGRNRDRNTGGTSNRRTGTTASIKLDCVLPKACSGSSCCNADKDCEDQCDDWFSGKAEKECLKLSQDSVDEIDNILEILKDAKEDELDDISNDNVDLLCTILDDLDHNAWFGEVKKYTTAKADRVLAWMIDDDEVTAILDSIDSDDAVDIMKHLISRAGSSSSTISSSSILTGLNTGIGDDSERVLVYADGANNEGFIEWVHENIVEDQICANAVLPTCNTAATGSGITACNSAGESSLSNEIKRAACKLGVYCKVIPRGEQDTRASIADILNDSDVKDFIETAQSTSGTGLGLSADDDDAEEWTNIACDRLKLLWSDGSGLDLDLTE